MTNKEIVNRNIGLTFDLIRKIIENPDLAYKIHDHSVIEFVEKDFEVKQKTPKKEIEKALKIKKEYESQRK